MKTYRKKTEIGNKDTKEAQDKTKEMRLGPNSIITTLPQLAYRKMYFKNRYTHRKYSKHFASPSHVAVRYSVLKWELAPGVTAIGLINI